MSVRDHLPARVLPAVLMYHRIAQVGGPHDPYAISPAQFAAQLGYLARRGFTSVPADADAAPPAGKAVAITFDDGYLDTYEVAFPLLLAAGFTATVFLVSGCMGRTSSDWGPREPVPLMTWEQAREMSRHGISFQSHTRTHVDLTRCPDTEALEELGASRAAIEQALGTRVDAIAYPFGRYDERTLELAQRAGYRRGWAAGLSAGESAAGERFQVNARDGLAAFAVKASGWAGWLRRQRARLLRTDAPSPIEVRTC